MVILILAIFARLVICDDRTRQMLRVAGWTIRSSDSADSRKSRRRAALRYSFGQPFALAHGSPLLLADECWIGNATRTSSGELSNVYRSIGEHDRNDYRFAA